LNRSTLLKMGKLIANMTQKIRVAVIGAGSMGQNHARVLSSMDDVILAGVADINIEQAKKIATRFKTRFFSDYKKMFDALDIDAVIIAVPTSFHKECGLYAIEHGKHVLIEKPIAFDEIEAQEIIERAKEKKVTLAVGHIERFNPAIVELKKRLDDGELGEIYKIDVQRIGPYPIRINDVGVVIDLSVHDIDIINYLMESEVEYCYAETQKRLNPYHEDILIAILRYKNSVLAILNVNFLSPVKIREISVFGKKGSFRVDYLNQDLYFYENRSFIDDAWQSVSEGDIKKITLFKKESLQAELESFVSCIRENKSPAVSGEDGLQALKIAHLLIDSSKNGTVFLYKNKRNT